MPATIGINTSPALASGTTGGGPQWLGRVAGPVWAMTTGGLAGGENTPAFADEKWYTVAAPPATAATTTTTQAFEISRVRSANKYCMAAWSQGRPILATNPFH